MTDMERKIVKALRETEKGKELGVRSGLSY